MSGEVLSQRAINRATLERQLLLRRADMPVIDAIKHLAGLQAQAPFPPYFVLCARLCALPAGAAVPSSSSTVK
jgi:hypothetical protein